MSYNVTFYIGEPGDVVKTSQCPTWCQRNHSEDPADNLTHEGPKRTTVISDVESEDPIEVTVGLMGHRADGGYERLQQRAGGAEVLVTWIEVMHKEFGRQMLLKVDGEAQRFAQTVLDVAASWSQEG